MGLLFWLTVAPLIAAILILAIPKLPQNGYRSIAVLGGVASLIMTLIAWGLFNTGNSGFQLQSTLHWFSFPDAGPASGISIGLNFGVDGLSLPLVTLATVVVTLAMLSMRKTDRIRAYSLWMSLAAAAAIGVFTALDVFTFLVALELGLAAMFFLIYLFGDPDTRVNAAFKFLIYRGVASVMLIIGLLLLAFGVVGAVSGTQPGVSLTSAFNLQFPSLIHWAQTVSTTDFTQGARDAIFMVIFIGVLVEEALVPFHTWLPTAHESSDTATNMLLGGILTKTGAYILLRFGVGMLPGEVRHFGVLIAVLGVINILYGAFVAWHQSDWRRLIAFGSISHMGIVLLGIAAVNSAGLQGAMFMIVSSGLLNALLFYTIGVMGARTETFDMSRLGGLSKQMPMLSGFLLLAALGSLGLPLTSGFISEIQAFVGAFESYPATAFVGVLGLIMSAVYLLYAIQKTTFGPAPAGSSIGIDARPAEYVPLVVLAGLVLLVGVDPQVIGHFFNLSVQALLRIGG